MNYTACILCPGLRPGALFFSKRALRARGSGFFRFCALTRAGDFKFCAPVWAAAWRFQGLSCWGNTFPALPVKAGFPALCGAAKRAGTIKGSFAMPTRCINYLYLQCLFLKLCLLYIVILQSSFLTLHE